MGIGVFFHIKFLKPIVCSVTSFKMTLMDSSLVKVQYVTEAKWIMYHQLFQNCRTSMPSPIPTPRKKQKKNISPIPHRGCLIPGKTCKSYSLKKYTPANFKAFIQHSRRAQMITKRSREAWGKCWINLGSPWLVYHISHRTRYRNLLSGFAFPAGHLLPKMMTAGTLEPRLLTSLYSLTTCIHT